MTTADQIRALADTGTPLPWMALVGNSWGGRSAAGTTDGYPVGFTGDDPNSGPDAVKIVAAVNALPHIADLIDAFDNVPLDGDPSPEPWEQWWRNLFAARDALVEALGVTA